MHNDPENPDYSGRDQPWVLIKLIECDCRLQARRIEAHIKKMKSRKYIENLLIYDEIATRLKERYSCI